MPKFAVVVDNIVDVPRGTQIEDTDERVPFLNEIRALEQVPESGPPTQQAQQAQQGAQS